jgi:ribosomal protein S18 acetylase RimI-like enzyme
MYDFILPILKKNKVNKMVLEVLAENLPAIKTYQKQGFEIVRTLDCFKGKLTENRSELAGFTIVELTVLNWHEWQPFWEYPPTWQNSIATTSKLQKQTVCFGIQKDGYILGYLIYNRSQKRVHQLAIHKDFRNIGLGSYLLNEVFRIEKAEIAFINIDARITAFKHFLENKGFQYFTSQYEMILPIPK